MKTSETVTKISEALLKAQSKISHAIKDAKNPHFKNNYATLESVIDASKQALLENGIFVLQSPSDKVLTTRLQHVSGEFFESELGLMLTKNDMQGLGSAITYARRYSLASFLNISQADDDGNAASDVVNKPVQNVAQKVNVQDAIHGAKAESKDNGFDFDSYIIQLGKNNMTGTKLSDHKIDWLQKAIDSTVKWHKDNNKSLHKNTSEFVEMATAYIESKMSQGEEIPF